MSALFELRPTEIPANITFREGGRKFRVTHIFRPPEFADWLEYERALNSSVEIEGGCTRFDQARGDASEAIWDRCILRVEGYLVGAQASSLPEERAGSPRSQLPEAFPDTWRDKVPLIHKMAAVALLAQVSAADSPDVETYHFDPEQTEILLDAARGGNAYRALVHVLRRPTVRQQKEFSRVISTALYVRGSRTEKSLLPSRLREMVKFYDELIVEARGYCVNRPCENSDAISQPPPHNCHPESLSRVGRGKRSNEGTAFLSREEAVKYMDAMHKKTAISALFSVEDSESEPPFDSAQGREPAERQP